MITTYERGKIDGRLEGKLEGKSKGKLEGKLEGGLEGKLEDRRETLLVQLEAKFGPLAPQVVQRLELLDMDQLRQLSVRLLKAGSVDELGLKG